jgi:hypothetical protein
MMKAISTSETSVNFYQTTWLFEQEEQEASIQALHQDPQLLYETFFDV